MSSSWRSYSIRTSSRSLVPSARAADRHLIFRPPARRPTHCSLGLWTLLAGLRIGVRGQPRIVLSTGDRDMPKAAFYAVAAGRKPGIYSSWAEAEAQVKGYAGAKFKKFHFESEARAFIAGASSGNKSTVQAASATSGAAPATSARGTSPVAHATPSELSPELASLAEKGWRFSKKTPTALVVYTDGSGIGNGKKGAKAGLGVWWGDRGDAGAYNLAERVPGDLQTNNRGELLSVIRALETCPFPDMPLEVRTDSQYTIMCMTTYLPGWLRNGFKTSAKKTATLGGVPYARGDARSDVKNADMIKHLLVLLRRRGTKAPVRFKHVRGHIGVEGNEGADRLARMGAAHPALPDRLEWLDPDQVDTKDEPPSTIDLEIDEEWLMSPDELNLFERNFVEVDQ